MDLADIATGLLLLTAAAIVARWSGALTPVTWCLLLAGATWFAPEMRTGLSAVDVVLGSFVYLHLGFLSAAALLASGWRGAAPWGGILIAGSWPLAGRSGVWLAAWEALSIVATMGLVRGTTGRRRGWAACGMAFTAGPPVAGRALSAWASPTTASWAAPSAYEVLIVGSAVSIVAAVAASRALGGAVTDAVIRIAAGESGVARQLLAEALGDPSVDVAVRVAEGWADEQGRLRSDLVERPGRVVIRVVVDGDVVARIGCREGAAQRPEVRRAIEAAGLLASDNADLRTQLKVTYDRLEDARRRLVVVEDEQRSSLSRRLLTDTSVATGEIARRLTEAQAAAADSPELAAALRETFGQHQAVEKQLEELANGLAPNVEGGLDRTVMGAAQRLGLEVEVDIPVDPLPELWRTVYFVCMEALSNVAKHAATNRARVMCHVSGDTLTLVVRDDGRGGASTAIGTGLQGIADRVSALGGSCTVQSPAGEGTTVTVTLPVAAALVGEFPQPPIRRHGNA